MRERITITIDRELLEWIDRRVKSRIFANRSHGFEFLIEKKVRRDEGENYYNP
jgi:metal-responsive CopG/Arc/MetJ family transcriptional regulator